MTDAKLRASQRQGLEVGQLWLVNGSWHRRVLSVGEYVVFEHDHNGPWLWCHVPIGLWASWVDSLELVRGPQD